jgi:hypothetical protein
MYNLDQFTHKQKKSVAAKGKVGHVTSSLVLIHEDRDYHVLTYT